MLLSYLCLTLFTRDQLLFFYRNERPVILEFVRYLHSAKPLDIRDESPNQSFAEIIFFAEEMQQPNHVIQVFVHHYLPRMYLYDRSNMIVLLVQLAALLLFLRLSFSYGSVFW